MDPETQRALDAIDRAVAEVRQLMAHPVVLSASYLAAIDRVERMPHNQSGADKTWVLTLQKRSAELMARVVRKR